MTVKQYLTVMVWNSDFSKEEVELLPDQRNLLVARPLIIAGRYLSLKMVTVEFDPDTDRPSSDRITSEQYYTGLCRRHLLLTNVIRPGDIISMTNSTEAEMVLRDGTGYSLSLAEHHTIRQTWISLLRSNASRTYNYEEVEHGTG